MTHLVVDNVVKAFDKQTVLNGVSLAVERGETMCVFGPSGAGKTVLLRLISGVIEPDFGDIRLGNSSLVGQAPEARGIGMAFQNFALYPHMPAFENIASPLRAQRLDEAAIRRRVDEVANLLKIGHVLHHLPRELSNGQKQRTALARALARAPKVLLLDDPLRNVDAKLRYEMRLELPRVLRQFGSTAIYVTQDYKEAMALGQRIAVLMDGHFVQTATPASIYREPGSVTVARLFGDPTINLYPVRRDGRATADVLGAEVNLPGHMQEGRDCLVGIRPEDVRIGMEETAGSIPVDLDAVTPLNVRAVLLLRTREGRELLASCSEDEGLRFGRGHKAVWASIDWKNALWFDAASGHRLAA